MELSKNKILITGAASGIGFGLVERFIKEDNSVIICGRRADALADAAARLPGLITRVCDLADDNQRIDLYKWIDAEHGDLNVLVNNAGIQQWMSVFDDNFIQ